jgi:16S rRNA (adenine(1408)-N(1))-methyltransferase
VLHAARRQPGASVIGIDTAAEAMRESSRRASRRLAAGGAPNALFLVGDATRLDGLQVLAGRVDDVRVTLPWGSLGRAVLDAEPALVDGLAALLRPGGRLNLLLSLTERDLRLGRHALADAEVTRLAHGLAAGRFAVCHARPATSEDVGRMDSSWAKRLGIPHQRPAWVIVLERLPSPRGTAAPRTGV